MRGWLRVAVDEPELLAAAPEWWLDGAPYAVRETRPHSGALLAKLEGIDTPEQAKALRGRPVVIPRPAAGEGRYYWSDLVGLEVVNAKGVRLGAVTRPRWSSIHTSISTMDSPFSWRLPVTTPRQVTSLSIMSMPR